MCVYLHREHVFDLTPYFVVVFGARAFMKLFSFPHYSKYMCNYYCCCRQARHISQVYFFTVITRKLRKRFIDSPANVKKTLYHPSR